jgi:hypothetical protein
VKESLLKFLVSPGYKVSREKAQLCLPQVNYLGMILKGQTHSLSHERIDPILRFPLLQTIKQLGTFLGVTRFCRLWIPRYAALVRLLFMLLPIFLFGSCIINALSRFISQQVQQIKVQLLLKEYSSLPVHEHSIPFYWGPLETTQVNP